MKASELAAQTIPIRRRPGVSRLATFFLGVKTRNRAHEALAGIMFISPWLVGLLLFFGGPILASLVLSFTDYSLVQDPKWVGFANFQTAFAEDRLFWSSLGRTFRWAIVYTPVAVLGSLVLAVLLNQKLVATNVFRTVFFLPHLTPAVALVVLWQWLLHPELGVVNFALGKLGLPQPGWLSSPDSAMAGLMIMGLWGAVGGNRMLIFLAGLQGVPQELYESAEIDGAGALAKFRNITIPMISPVIFFNVVLGIIGALQVFTTAFVATQGGPAYATYFFALHIYNQSFRYFRMGYGSLLAWVLGMILIVFTLIQVKLSSRWVYYSVAD